jgi:hypothetical protein
MAIEDKPELRERVPATQRAPRVLAARSCAPRNSDEGNVDVFLVWDALESRREVWRVVWDLTLHGGPYARSKTVVGLDPALVIALSVVDLDGDGAEEVITLEAGANLHFPVLVDFETARTRELLPREHGMCQAREWRFANLDEDAAMECIAAVPAQYCYPPDDDRRVSLRGETRWLVYDMQDGKYQLSRIDTRDPTP